MYSLPLLVYNQASCLTFITFADTFWGDLWSSCQEPKKNSPCLVSVLLKLLPDWRSPSLPAPPSHVQAVPVLTALLPGYQNYHQPRGWETAQTRISNRLETHRSPGNDLSADSTTDLSQSPLKAISSPFQYGFEKAQNGSGAAHKKRGSYIFGAYGPCSGVQWEFHRGLLTEVSTKPSVTQLIGPLLHGGACQGQWVSGKLRRSLIYPALSHPRSLAFPCSLQQFEVTGY